VQAVMAALPEARRQVSQSSLKAAGAGAVVASSQTEIENAWKRGRGHTPGDMPAIAG